MNTMCSELESVPNIPPFISSEILSDNRSNLTQKNKNEPEITNCQRKSKGANVFLMVVLHYGFRIAQAEQV